MTQKQEDEINPLVSAVIPTRNRPELVCRAVRSALRQTYTNLEVVVVVDGPDPATVNALEALNEPRLRIVALDENVGGSEARNVGIREANGHWIALLDDDDQWMHDKVSKQLEAAVLSSSMNPVVTARVIAKRADTTQIWPDRRPIPGEPISEYLMCRTRITSGEGFIQCSTLLARRTLLLEHPFTRGLPRGQDWDWVLRVAEEPSVCIEWVWEPLVIYDIAGGHTTITGTGGWREFHYWAKHMKPITPKAFRYFLAAHLAPRIRLPRDLLAVPGLLVEMFPRGEFSFHVLRIFLVFLLIPVSFRRSLAQKRFWENRGANRGRVA